MTTTRDDVRGSRGARTGRPGALSRRGVLRGLGAAGVAAGLWHGLGAGGPPAQAALVGRPGAEPVTWLRDQRGSWALLTTGPFQSLGLPAGARLGACLVVAGAPGAGRGEPAITQLDALRLVPSGQASGAVGGLAELQPDPGVERCTYRLLGALDAARPADLFGFSGTVDAAGLTAGQAVDLAWEATLRGAQGGAQGSVQALRDSLRHYHAWVLGQLTAETTFTAHLAYVQVRDVE